MADDGEPLSKYEDDELGRLVRDTPVFRAAVACDRFAAEIEELRENETEIFDRLLDDTVAEHDTAVKKDATVHSIVEAFLDVVEGYAHLSDNPDELAEEAARQVVEDEGGEA